MLIRQMFATHPRAEAAASDALLTCIEECLLCAQVCTTCADACLAEETVAELRQCIRVNLDCADMCLAAAQIASRRTGQNGNVVAEALSACMVACRICGDECDRHAGNHQHCLICADACRRCEWACNEAIRSIRRVH